MEVMFSAINFGQWFYYLTGMLELIAAILLFIPSLTGIGALLIACIMVGAISANLFLIGGSFTLSLSLFFISLLEIIISRKKILRVMKIYIDL